MPSRVLVLALACCLALAGCNGMGGANDKPTVTPAPVPTAATSDAVADTTLATRHATVLSATNYTVVIHERITTGNRTLRVDRNRRKVARGAIAYSLVRERNLTAARTATVAPRVAYWYNGTLAVARTWATGETSYHVAPNTTGPLVTPSERSFLARIAASSELSSGRDKGVVRATRLRNPATAPHGSFVERPQNASVVLDLTDAGYVSEYRYAYEGSVEGLESPVRVVRRARFVNVGETAVRPPAWVARAD